ncbi:hypothetical protein EXS66_02600, partial [Candidatus Saccharibacteria bacterium]|nr:hypothetical protein [Candidatus Saccharibacteria bacterium]
MKYYFKFKSFLPLIVIFIIIMALVLVKAMAVNNFSTASMMLDFMAGFFLVFGAFKVAKLSAFAEAYQMYDIVAKRSKLYAHIYPFIEIALGLAF